MEIHNNTNKQLNDLLNEARHEKPVMNIKEVESIISKGKYTPTGGSRGFHIGMNNLIVMCGIVVSSFLAYMALKVDKGDLVSGTTTVENQTSETIPANSFSVQSESQTGDQTQTSFTASEAETKPRKESPRVQPTLNTSALTASKDEIIAVPADETTGENISEVPASAKLPSGEYFITFNYNEQDVKMKLVDEEISEFYVDGQAIPAEQYGDYEDILSEGKNYLMGRGSNAEGTSTLNLINYFDNQLRSDKILDREVQYKFELSYSQLLINGTVQPEEMFKKYKGLYEAKTGKTITVGSVYKFERGARSE